MGAPTASVLRLARGITGPVSIFAGAGSPNNSASPDVQFSGVGSIYLQTDAPDTTHTLWVCTGGGKPAVNNGASTISTWTNK
jgi:hypothetical protein